MITFDYDAFIALYPEFTNYMNEAAVTIIYNNQAVVIGQAVSALFSDDDVQYYYNCLVLAHILYCRQFKLSGMPTNVAQGSDSAAFVFEAPQWASYWLKTPYGQEIYETIKMYRSGGYYMPYGDLPYNSDAMNGAGIYEYYW